MCLWNYGVVFLAVEENLIFKDISNLQGKSNRNVNVSCPNPFKRTSGHTARLDRLWASLLPGFRGFGNQLRKAKGVCGTQKAEQFEVAGQQIFDADTDGAR